MAERLPKLKKIMAPRKGIAFTPARTALFFGGLALAAIIGYSIYAALPLLEGPALSVTLARVNRAIAISGRTERVAFLEVNGAPVPLREDGTFSIERAYPPGYTAITVNARDRFGKQVTRQLSLVTPDQ